VLRRVIYTNREVVVYRRRNSRFVIGLFFFAGVWFAHGCAGDSADGGDGAFPAEDAGHDPDAGVPMLKRWVAELVEDADVGLQARVAVGPNDQPVVAYWANKPFADGTCDEVPVDPPTRMRHDLRVASRDAAGQWTVETADSPVFLFDPTGLDLAFDAAGQPGLAYTGRDPETGFQYCGGSDAIVARKSGGQWTYDTAGTVSGDSATGIPGSDEGFIVGIEPALAFDEDGNPAVLHRDAHFVQGISTVGRADAEFAWRRDGGWLHEAVDPGEGAGFYNDLAFDGQNRPVAFYAITDDKGKRNGVWVARREEDGTWNRIKIHSGTIYKEIAAGVNPTDGSLVAAFYSGRDYAVRIRTLSEPDRFMEIDAWADEVVGDALYDEGQYVSLAFTPAGAVALAYHRCRYYDDPEDEGCNQNDEAAVFAVKRPSGWDYEVVRQVQRGSCGEYTSLAIDSAGNAYVAYMCTAEEQGEFLTRFYVSSKQ
jgi:hypothetical protein